MTTDPMVVQKKTPGHCEESNMAKTTVKTKITTSTRIPPMMRVLKLPLKIKMNIIYLLITIGSNISSIVFQIQ